MPEIAADPGVAGSDVAVRAADCATIEIRDLGRMRYGEALDIQQELVEKRKRGLIPDQLIFVEHPHVITQGRNGRAENLLAGEDALRSAGIEYYPTNRGGDITYHGPGQIVGYPIVDLREWKRDVVAYVRAIEQAIVDALADFNITAGRIAGCTGVWVDGSKVAAIGVHISRWVTSHGFALNHATDLRYFQYIVPCGLTKPVTSMQKLGSDSSRASVLGALSTRFARQFEWLPVILPSREPEEAVSSTETYS
jgi:lipoyl(octanoyl) transferase